jgi:hypothetical protein
MYHATDIINMIPKGDGTMSPFVKRYGKNPNIEILKLFGTECYAKVPEELRRKLDDKSEKCYYFVKRSLTTKMESKLEDSGRSVRKSMEMSCQGACGIGSGCKRP